MALPTFLIVVLFALIKNSITDDVIIEGEDASINDYPYVLSLQDDRGHYCGGCYLTERRAITAAHCTYGKNPDQLLVRAGSNHTDIGGELAKVADIKPHPNFNLRTSEYDVAILILATPILNRIKINLPAVNQEVPIGAWAESAGWIETKDKKNRLQKVKTERITDAECNAKYNNQITSVMFCFSTEKKNVCQGDDGGPIFYSNKLVGVVSWGQRCGYPDYPGVYVKIAEPSIHAFIIHHLN